MGGEGGGGATNIAGGKQVVASVKGYSKTYGCFTTGIKLSVFNDRPPYQRKFTKEMEASMCAVTPNSSCFSWQLRT